MPSKEKCAKEWKNLGYKSLSDCTGYKRKKEKTQASDTSVQEEYWRTRSDLDKAHGEVYRSPTNPGYGYKRKKRKGRPKPGPSRGKRK